MATFLFQGRVFATPSAATILIEGQEVFSGQVGSGQPLDTPITLLETVSAGGAVSISVTSGVISVGTVNNCTLAGAWNPSTTYTFPYQCSYNDANYNLTQNAPAGTVPTNTEYWEVIPTTSGPDRRSSILINGVAPEWPATPVTPMPGGTQADPNWAHWFFEVGAGETITFNIEE